MKVTTDVSFSGNRLIGFSGSQTLTLDFDTHRTSLNDVILFPGIFNAHDHLEFNLFPYIGDGLYNDYIQWGADIHAENKTTIESITGIPMDLRIRWGILKNLINGITHVVHHGGHHTLVKTISYPVFLNYQYLHSLETERYWKLKLNSWSGKNVMVHIGEGTSQRANEEIDRVLTWNLLKRKLIGIHAIGMTPAQSVHFKSVVWCPVSNMNLYGATASVDKLHMNTAILFGTDSTLTGSPNFWDHLRLARNLGMLSDSELFETLTNKPREVLWKNAPFSFVVAKKKSTNSLKAFFELNPEDIILVAIDGVVRLADESILHNESVNFSRVQVGTACKFITTRDAAVLNSLKHYPVSIPLNVTLLS